MNDRILIRLFAAVWFSSRRFNCYLSLEYFLLVRGVFEGSEEVERLKMVCNRGRGSNKEGGGVRG